MHTVWCAAKVMACSACASASSGQTWAAPAVMAMRNAISAAASTSQPARLKRGSQRPCVKNQPISIATENAHISPITVLE